MPVLLEERPRIYTPDDLLRLPEAEHCELLDGALVEKPMGAESDWIGLQIATRLSSHVLSNNAGWVFGPETGYQCFGEKRNRIRKPDVSFVRGSRLEAIPRGHIQIVPDLAVEVISPNDLYSEVQQKVQEYQQAGFSLIWIVDPLTRTVDVLEAGAPVQRLAVGDVLTGGSILPEFRCELAEIFPPVRSGTVEEEQ
ncbi:MAG: Uma2 family endonuclease [Actinomycetota bacterium]